jgi:hypothetical protein
MSDMPDIYVLGIVEVETYDNVDETQLAAAHDVTRLYEWALRWAVARSITVDWTRHDSGNIVDVTKPFDWTARHVLFITRVPLLDAGPTEADVLAVLDDFRKELEEARKPAERMVAGPVERMVAGAAWITPEEAFSLGAPATTMPIVEGPDRCICTAQGGSEVYSSGCPVHDPR